MIFSEKGGREMADERETRRPRADVDGVAYVYAPGTPRGAVNELFPHMRVVSALASFNVGLDDDRRSAGKHFSPHFDSPVGFGRIAACAGFLGVVGGVHACVGAQAAWSALISGTEGLTVLRWCLYALFMVVFHSLEFVLTAAYNPRTATSESFLLNHSKAYKIAAVAAWIEYAIESALFPALKSSRATLFVGFCVLLAGQTIRTAAMAQAKSNFTHQVANQKQSKHRLVTSGLYAHLRHPSYFGWFWWSVGTQVLLANPLCAVAYFAASWKFFAERIPHEEDALARFFPDEYPAYKARTRVGIPFIA